jgi:hypothetical protein
MERISPAIGRVSVVGRQPGGAGRPGARGAISSEDISRSRIFFTTFVGREAARLKGPAVAGRGAGAGLLSTQHELLIEPAARRSRLLVMGQKRLLGCCHCCLGVPQPYSYYCFVV